MLLCSQQAAYEWWWCALLCNSLCYFTRVMCRSLWVYGTRTGCELSKAFAPLPSWAGKPAFIVFTHLLVLGLLFYHYIIAFTNTGVQNVCSCMYHIHMVGCSLYLYLANLNTKVWRINCLHTLSKYHGDLKYCKLYSNTPQCPVPLCTIWCGKSSKKYG